jgi:hypothetical protein
MQTKDFKGQDCRGRLFNAGFNGEIKMNIAEHKLNLFRSIDQMPEELLLELEQMVSKLWIKNMTKEKSLDNLMALESFLKPRIEAAKNGDIINKSVLDIFAEVHADEME